MLDAIIFNVEHGQSIFFYPQGHPTYGMFIDCGNTTEFDPINLLIKWGFLPPNGQKHLVSNLTLTNYDHDHFSGLPYLMEKASISTIRFANNLTSAELISIKPEQTEALGKVCDLKNTYNAEATWYKPPYEVMTFSLNKSDFPDLEPSTNNLSQVVFVSYGNSTICVTGDLEALGWEKIMAKPGFKEWLGRTNILVAAHHGRENGYAEEVFAHCSPECIIFSDKEIIHGTQDGMGQAYSAHVAGEGITVINYDSSAPKRKILTTRSDGHIWVRFKEGGVREYKTV